MSSFESTAKKSETAGYAALFRALGYFEDRAFSAPGDELAVQTLAPYWKLIANFPLARRIALQVLDLWVPGLYFFHNTRTAYIDRWICEAVDGGARQVVILGAGMDTRARRLASTLESASIFELDAPGNRARKMRLWETIGLDERRRPTYIEYDLRDHRLHEVLCDVGFDPDKPTVCLAEGLVPYLPTGTFEHVLRCAGKFPENSTLIFDYFTRDFVDNPDQYHGGRRHYDAVKVRGEPYQTGVEESEVAELLAEYGLSVRDNRYGRKLYEDFIDNQLYEVMPYGGITRAVR